VTAAPAKEKTARLNSPRLEPATSKEVRSSTLAVEKSQTISFARPKGRITLKLAGYATRNT